MIGEGRESRGWEREEAVGEREGGWECVRESRDGRSWDRERECLGKFLG